MKRLFFLCVLGMLLAMGFAAAESSAPKAMTVMVYMCGSNLETLSGSATADIGEMLASDFDVEQVNLVVMAGGSRRWDKDLRPGEAGTIEFFRKRGALKKKLVKPTSDVNMGDPETLTGFIRDSLRRYPAEEYALIIWDHGAGPLEGVCLDELNEPDRISLDGMTQALEAAGLPKKLSWIGFDACLMSTLEVANAIAPYADYMIASEETEPATGWDYAFLRDIETDGGSVDTARRIIDLYMETPREEGEALTLACTDLSKIDAVVSELDAFFKPISKSIGQKSFAKLSNLRMSSTGFGHTVRGVGVDGYDLVDLKDLTQRYAEENDTRTLLEAISEAVVYQRSTGTGVGGLSVYHPYYNRTMFREGWGRKYSRLAFCGGYAEYVQNFGTLLDGEAIANWQGMVTRDEGFDAGNVNRFSLQLTPEQQASFSSAQLIALYPHVSMNASAFLEDSSIREKGFSFWETNTTYSPIYISNASMDAEGRLSAQYAGRALYVTDAQGDAILGPLSYRLSADGQTYYICAQYSDTSGREDSEPSVSVIFACQPGADGYLTVVRAQVYDPLTDTYSNRVSLSPERYTQLAFDSLAASMPYERDPLPGFDARNSMMSFQPKGSYQPYDNYRFFTGFIDTVQAWQLRFFDFQQSGLQTYVAFQVTDSQQNTYMSSLTPLENQNLDRIPIPNNQRTTDRYVVNCHMVRDISPLSPTLSVCLEFEYIGWEGDIYVSDVLIGDDFSANAGRSAKIWTDENKVSLLERWADTPQRLYFQISSSSLMDLTEIGRLEIQLSGDESPLVFQIASCDISDIAPRSGVPLAEAEQDGVTMQLLSLERRPGDSITGTLHIVNRSSRVYECQEEFAINGLRLQGTSESYDIQTGTDGYVDFTLYDNAYISGKLSIKGKNKSRFLAQEKLLRRYADETVRQVNVIHSYGYDVKTSWQFDLAEPVSLESADPDAVLSAAKALPLLRGDLSAEVDRVLIADNGVGVRMILRNHGDEDIQVLIHNRLVNGISVDNDYPQSFPVCAHGVTVACLGIDAYPELEPGCEITDIGFTFCCNNRVSQIASIRLKQPVMLSRINGEYLSCEDLETQPAELSAGDIRFDNSDFEDERFAVRVASVQWENGIRTFNSAFRGMGHQGLRLGFTIEVENRTDMTIDAVSTEFVLNGELQTDTSWIEFDIPPHSSNIETWYVDSEDLWNLQALHGMRCDMIIRESSDYGWGELLETIPIDIKIEEIGLDDAVEPLCETEVDGVTWQLLSLEADADGRLRGWLNAINPTSISREYSTSTVFAEGIRGDSHIPRINLKAHSHLVIPFVFENNVRLFSPWITSSSTKPAVVIPGTTHGYARKVMDRLLQRHGIREVTQLSFAMGFDNHTKDDAWYRDRFFTLELPEPLPIGDVATPESSGALLMRDDSATVSLQSVMVGNESVCLQLEIENRSDDVVEIWDEKTYVDGVPKVLQSHSRINTSLMPPHTITCLCFYANELIFEDSVQSLRVYFNNARSSGTLYVYPIIHLKASVELPQTEGIMLPESDYDVESEAPAPNDFSDILPLPSVYEVVPRTVVAPISPEKAARFVKGQAAICTEAIVSKDERYLTEHVMLDLTQDASGQISAPYSGLVMCWSEYPSIAYEETEGAISYITTTLYEYSDDYLEFELRPAEDPGDVPDLVPTEVPYYYEEGMELNSGIKSTYHYTIRNADGALKLLDWSVVHRRMSPDDPPEIEEEYDPMVGWIVQNTYLNENYDDPDERFDSLPIYDERAPSMLPVRMLNQYDDENIVVLYHIWYDDGTEEFITESY